MPSASAARRCAVTATTGWRSARRTRTPTPRFRSTEAEAERRLNELREFAHAVVFDVNDALSPIPGTTAARKLVVETALRYLDRLAEDHANAKRLAGLIDGVGGVRVVPPDTNIVMVDLTARHSAADIVAEARTRGVLVAEWSPTRLRMVTHLDVSAEDCRFAGDTIRELVARV